MTQEAEKLTHILLSNGINPVCMWCNRRYSEHTDIADPIATPRVVCTLLKSHFYPAKKYGTSYSPILGVVD